MVVCGVTVLARLFGPGHHCQVDRRLGNTATSTPNVIFGAGKLHSVDGARADSGYNQKEAKAYQCQK
jgi:hypothetical protein